VVKLSVLIATIGRRNDMFEKLMRHLLLWADGLPVEFIAYWNTGELSIGEIRQALLEEATGEYVCFVDDDDWLPEDYFKVILPVLTEDYVGFNVELLEVGRHVALAYHSLRYTGWSEDDKGFYRAVTHLNPIKRELALLGTFRPGGAGEDESWARQVTPHTKTEVYLDRVMYYYLHDNLQTTFGGKLLAEKTYYRPPVEHTQFRYHHKSNKEGRMK
jgi:glycosyltransferase involved in cell wall biosynthesis